MPHFDHETKLDFTDVVLRPRQLTISGTHEVSLWRLLKFPHTKKKCHGIPLIASNMETIGTFEMAEELAKFNILTAIHKKYTVSEWNHYVNKTGRNKEVLSQVAVSIGASDTEFTKLQEIIEVIPELEYICVDDEHAYSEEFASFIKRVREAFPSHTIFAGNVVTPEMVKELIQAGADVVKIGPGTQLGLDAIWQKTGIGYPQLSALIECAKVAHDSNGHIMCDGGCSSQADLTKAFAAGADMIMIGDLLPALTEADVKEATPKRKKNKADVKPTASSNYRCEVNKIVQDILDGLHAACKYTGVLRIKDLTKTATFVRVTQLRTAQ